MPGAHLAVAISPVTELDRNARIAPTAHFPAGSLIGNCPSAVSFSRTASLTSTSQLPIRLLRGEPEAIGDLNSGHGGASTQWRTYDH